MLKSGSRRRAVVRLGWMLLAFIAGAAQAGVNTKNGNFYITYTDISIEGAVDLDVVRTYNSRAGRVGLFGVGWGSDYETVLRVLGDGRIEIQENGTGRVNEFYPPVLTAQERIASVEAILEAIERDRGFESEQARLEQREKLLGDAELRGRTWSRYLREGALRPREVAPGSVFRSVEFGEQYVLRTHDGYRRFSGQDVDVFDREGRLVQMRREGGYYVNLIRDHRGRLDSITDSLGRVLQIAMDADGKIIRIESSGGSVAEYFYDGDRLVRTRDAGGNVFVHRYDRNANMLTIGYGSGDRLVNTYAGTEFDGTQFVRSSGRTGREVTWYRYGDYYKRSDGEAYFTEIIREFPNGAVRTVLLEYWIATMSDGTSYTQRHRQTVDGAVRDTAYDPNGRPTRIEEGGRVARFEYDGRGRVTLRDDGSETTRLTYDDRVGKIATVIQYQNDDADTRLEASYDYDALGNLTRAQDSTGRDFRLEYADGKIVRAESPETTLDFEYGPLGKPVRIELEGKGAIVVSYDSAGEILSVESEGDGGHVLALEVTQAFQSLLSLVKPADVELDL